MAAKRARWASAASCSAARVGAGSYVIHADGLDYRVRDGTVVTVTGAGFTPTSVVSVAGEPVDPQYLSSSQLQVAMPAGAGSTRW